MFGTSITGFALGVWVFEEVGSATIYAMIALANAIPLVLLSPIAGAIVDRMNRKIIILVAQIASFSITAVLMLLYTADALRPWHIIALVALNSIFLAFVFPAVTATVPLMVHKEQLTRANGMIALAAGIIQLISPAISGTLYKSVGLDTIFTIDLCTYMFALVTIMLTFIPQPCPIETAKNKDEGIFSFLKSGWEYLDATPGLKYTLFFYSAVVSMLLGMSVMIQPMILAFANAEILGFIMSFAGLGMLFGSAIMIAFKNINRHMPMIFAAAFIAGSLSVLVPMSMSPWILAVGGFFILSCFPIYDANNRALLQRKVHSNMIGRVIGLRNFALGILNGIVLLATGYLSDKVFSPAMKAEGWLNPYLSSFYGMGGGRGIAVTISLLGIITLILATIAWFIRGVRDIDTLLEDVETPILDEDAILKGHAL
jgi:MFS family permease